MDAESLDETLLAAVRQRLGLPDRLDATFRELGTVYAAWCRGTGYDNINLALYLASHQEGRLPGFPASNYFERWLADGISNFCWANSEALGALLGCYGFAVSRVIGTMGGRRNEPVGPMLHGSLIATVDGERYLVDPTLLSEEPLPLREGQRSRAGSGSLRIWADLDGTIRWQLPQSRFNGTFRIDRCNLSREEFAEEHENSRDGLADGRLYRDKLFVRRNRDGGSFTYDRGHLIRRHGARFEVRRVTKEDPRELLVEQFGISEALAEQIPQSTLY